MPSVGLVTLDHLDPEPLSSQLAKILGEKITSGEITDVLPSNRTLRQEFGVGETVVTNAVKILEAQGLVVRVPRRGVYVRQQR